MISMGIDIGTTTICGVTVDGKTGSVLKSVTLQNDSGLKSSCEWEKIQDVNRIAKLCLEVKQSLLDGSECVESIGISGQMHGILYIDDKGDAVSPLYTWQDERGNQVLENGKTYCECLRETTGYPAPSGYGLTTHFYNLKNNLVPVQAVMLCTVGDYITMKLAGRPRPIMHKSMAASLGMFDVKNGRFDQAALGKAGIDASFLPDIGDKEGFISPEASSVRISMALGDNQSSFLGSVGGESNVLVNIGTGSQISIYSETYDGGIRAEYRPYLNGTFLLVEAPLCGGSSYEMLKHFFEMTLKLFHGGPGDDLYTIMNRAAERSYGHANSLKADTRFRGTRKEPGIRGSLTNIGMENFTPEHLIIGILQGICDELFEFYKKVPKEYQSAEIITGSGNGIRRNKVMQKIISDTFGRKLVIPESEEEASRGAAIYAMYAAGYIESEAGIRRMIRLGRGEAGINVQT